MQFDGGLIFLRGLLGLSVNCLFTTKLVTIELILVGESELFTWGGKFGDHCGGCHLIPRGTFPGSPF